MTDVICKICEINTGKYSCPRCNISYCSVDCFQSEYHIECSEAFYEKCVKEELKNQKIELEAKKKMYEILKRNQEQSDSEGYLDSDDSESEPDLASRVADLNLDDGDAIWEKLTSHEKKEFRKLISTGHIMKIIPTWEPWWITKKQKMLIQETDAEEINCEKICPPIRTNILELSKITKVPPSPYIAHMLVNVLGAYTCTVRWFKGTHLDMAIEAVSTCLALSTTLRTNEVFKNSVEAFMSLEQEHAKCEWLKDTAFDGNQVYEDLKDIAKGQYKNDLFFCTKAALSDLDSIVSKAIEILQEKKVHHIKRFTEPLPTPKQLLLINKKITYYLAWTIIHGHLLVDAIQNSNK